MTTTEPEGLACPECRSWFTPHRSDQAYCSAACNKKAANRELARSRRLYRALYHWRLSRTLFPPKWVCREIASWIREDIAAQRKPPPPHNFEANRGHEREPQAIKL